MEDKSDSYAVRIDALSKDEHDTMVLAKLGKRSVLRRRFGIISMLGFTCTILVTWEGSLILFTTGLTNGGSAGLVYGYLFVWAGTIAVFTTMAELASIAPTSGGQYHWVFMMAPPSIRKFMSYIVGWLVIAAWQGILAGCAFITATMIEALIVLNHPDYSPQQWHGTLLFWAITLLAVMLNALANPLIPKLEIFVLVLHLLGFFACLIPLLVLAPAKASTHEVFTVFYNGGAWPTQGLSFFVGIIGSVFAMFGCDSAVHMAEEVRNADVVVPWSMVGTTLLNGTLGFAMIIAVLFVTLDIESALESPTGQLGMPFMDIFVTNTSRGGATGMIILITIIIGIGVIAFVATTSRLIWAFARDRAFPGWRHVSKVQPNSTVPLHAVVITMGVSVLIGLINLGSTTAFNDVVSLGVSGLYASYVITEALLLYRRVTGAIRSPTDAHAGTGAKGELVWGPFHVPGVFGIVVNIIAVLFGTIIFFFSCWPVSSSVQPATMNYSSLMTGCVVIAAVVYYLFWARYTYEGPRFEEVDCLGS